METVEEYINSFPDDVQEHFKEIRCIIREHAPEATESIAYKMPAYKLKGKLLIYFAGFKNHIGFYATPTGHAAFENELAHYKQGKGSVQFPLNQPIPFDLIRRMVLHRVKENKAMAN